MSMFRVIVLWLNVIRLLTSLQCLKDVSGVCLHNMLGSNISGKIIQNWFIPYAESPPAKSSLDSLTYS